VALLTLGVISSAGAEDAMRGQQLFVGEAPLAARIVGQDFALPTQASRCVNCHGATAATPGASGAATQPAAPALSAATLGDAVRRRGGPPSRYDAAALCVLLRSGVDPAHVMIQRTMPRYEISDADCRALWRHLTAQGAAR
jgi:mono/diheme cytochrome c family protein